MTATYKWIGITLQGKKTTGLIDATTKQNAYEKLLNSNITILSLKKYTTSMLFQSSKLTLKQRLEFTQQLHVLLSASISLNDALKLIAQTTSHKIIKTTAQTLKEKLISGIKFSTALQQLNYFDKTYCQMISAGEQSGKLEIVLTQLIDNLEHRAQLKNKIGKALFYPLSVMGIALLISLGLLVFVIPQFKSIYNSFGAQLPLITRSLISISNYICHQGFIYLIPIGFLLCFFIKPTKFLFFSIPYCRTLIVMQQTAQWSQLLAMTLTAGIPLIEALHIANHTIAYPLMQSQLEQTQKAVVAGKSLFMALNECDHFPLQAKTMIAIGENADALPYMMKRIAIIYQQQLNDALERLSKLLEPVIMMMVASLVSGLIIAMYLPIFRMGSVVQ